MSRVWCKWLQAPEMPLSPVAGAILITSSMEDINTVKKKIKVGHVWVPSVSKLIFTAYMCDLCM